MDLTTEVDGFIVAISLVVNLLDDGETRLRLSTQWGMKAGLK